MDAGERTALSREVMGAAHVFCSATNELFERVLLETAEGTLGMAHVRLLQLIGHSARRFKVTDVADFLGVTNAAASRAIERLVQRGLVVRTISQEDRRAVNLALTPESEVLLERFAAARDAEVTRLLHDYPADKLERIATLLDELSLLLLGGRGETHERCMRCGVHYRPGCVVSHVLGWECAAS